MFALCEVHVCIIMKSSLKYFMYKAQIHVYYLCAKPT